MEKNEDGFKIDDMYKDGNIKVNTPKSKKKPETTDVEKLLKEVSLLNKQYNRLLVETNTLRKKHSYQDYTIRQLRDENNKIRNLNSRMRREIEDVNDDLDKIKKKLGL